MSLKSKDSYFIGLKRPVGNTHVKFPAILIVFIKEEDGEILGIIKWLKYKVYPIPSKGLKLPLSLKL